MIQTKEFDVRLGPPTLTIACDTTDIPLPPSALLTGAGLLGLGWSATADRPCQPMVPVLQ